MTALTWRQRRNIVSTVVLVFVLFVFWVSGGDFSERSPELGMAVVAAAFCALFCWGFPAWSLVNGRSQP